MFMITPRPRSFIREIGPRQIDIAEDLEIPGDAATSPHRLLDRAAGNGARIVHQDVDVRKRGEDLVARRLVREVGRERAHGDRRGALRSAAASVSSAAAERATKQTFAPSRSEPFARSPARSPSTRRSPGPCGRKVLNPFCPSLCSFRSAAHRPRVSLG